MTSLGINAYSQLKFAVSLAISQKLSSLLGSPGLKLGLSLSMKRIFSLRRLSTDGPWTVFLSVFLFFLSVESVEAVPSCICNEKSIKSPVSSYDLFFKKKKGRAKSHFTYLPSSLSFSLIFPFPIQNQCTKIVSQRLLKRIQRVCELWWENKLHHYFHQPTTEIHHFLRL